MALRAFMAPEAAFYPSSLLPHYTRIVGTNFPVTSLQFDDATTEECFWQVPTKTYSGGNVLRFSVKWYADNATSGVVRFRIRVAAITPNTDTQDIETKTIGTSFSADDTHLGTTGQRVHEIDMDLDSAGERDNLAAGDWLLFALAREGGHANDTMNNDCNVLSVELNEV